MISFFDIDKENCGLVLKAISSVSCGLYAGCALYVSVVESPARMTHDPQSAIAMWKPSFIRAKSLQSQLGLLSALTTIGVYGCFPEESTKSFWLIAGSSLFSIIPFTLLFIQPLNSQLSETERCISVKGDDWIVDNLKRWSRLHNVCTMIGVGSFGLIIYSLLRQLNKQP